MTTNQSSQSTSRRALRLWPAVIIAVLVWSIRFVLPVVAPDSEIELAGMPLGFFALLAPVAGTLAILVWWLFFSRARWPERLGALVLMIAAMFVTSRLVDVSIAGAGQGMFLYVLGVPYLALALVVWAVAAQRFTDGARWASLLAAIVIACAPWVMLRTGGVIGDGSDFHWRWTPTPEERLLAQAADEPLAPPPSAPTPETLTPAAPLPEKPEVEKRAVDGVKKATEASAADAPKRSADRHAMGGTPIEGLALSEPNLTRVEGRVEWPGFRGPNRDGVIHGVTIATDWATSPPKQLWRRPIGPGWSSFSVRGDSLYTQEQRGDDEIVASYSVSTGQPLWRHRDPVRFYESNGGAGPRATPTISGDRVYAFGATGILNALDARSGAVIWSRNVATDTSRRIPDWGFASSPLVMGDIVIVAAAGTLAAYDVKTGIPRWRGPSYGGSYSSPHRATIDGVEQVVLLGGPGAISVDPATGTVLWQHEWDPGPMVQPAFTEDGDILINAITMTGGTGIRRLSVKHATGGWNVEERWTSNGLKPYFNDFVVHKGHAYGFDGNILACIDLADGKRKWKGGRYGNGQLLLIEDQDLLLVTSEDGELALVSATSDQYKEIARVPVLDGKTWNHPVLVRDVLLVRNGQEMAAFRVTLTGQDRVRTSP
jgi:outer membrane protein assembly factor BamB